MISTTSAADSVHSIRATGQDTETAGGCYPNHPGYRCSGPSADAAEIVKEDAAKLRGRVREAFALRGDMTADEAAWRLREPWMTDGNFERFKNSVRSRISELKADGELFKTSLKRKNDSGMSATVWTIDKQAQLL
jgi:hypothetical protein